MCIRDRYEISRRILDAFPLTPKLDMPPEEIASREESLRLEFGALCVHLLSMAAAEIRVKGLHEKRHDPDLDEVTINDAACIAVSFLFYPRKRGGLREIVEIIRSLFRRNPDAGPVDLFNYLSAAVSRNLKQSAKQKARFENPWYSCIAKCVDFHVKSRPRYAVEGQHIIDTHAEDPPGRLPTATSEDILELCNRRSPIPKKPGAAIDLIFDCLRENNAHDGGIPRRELYLAVYKLLTPHMTVEFPRNSTPTPEDIYLISKLHVEACDLLGEMRETYSWRKIKDGVIQAAYLAAGEDILMDLINFGKPRNSRHEYLSAHIGGFTKKDWSVHRGSFQHFVKVLEQRWAERLHAL